MEGRLTEAHSWACWLAWNEPDLAIRARRWREAGSFARERLLDPAEAEACFRRSLAADPRGTDSADALAALLAERGEVQAAAELIARAPVPDPAVRARRLESAGLLLRGTAPARAAVYLREALAGSAAAGEARRALVDLFAQSRLFAGALRVCAAAPPGADRIRALVELGSRLVDEPLEHPLARRAFELALEEAPDHTVAAEALGRLAAWPKSWPQVARQLRAAAVEERDRRTAAGLYLRLAALHAAYDENGAAAAHEQLGRCFLLWPGMPAALDLIERLAIRWGDRGWAVRGFEALAPAARDRGCAADLWERAARLRRLDSADSQGADQALAKTLEADPERSSAIWDLFERLLDSGDRDGAARLLERPFGRVAASSGAVRLALGEWLISLGDRARAATQLEGLVERPPDAPAAFDAWMGAVRETGDALLAARALAIAAARADSAAGRRTSLVALAELERAQGRGKAVAKTLGEALWLAPGDPALLSALELLGREDGAAGEVAQSLGRALEAEGGGPATGPLARSLARSIAADPNRRAEAVALLQRVLEQLPGDAEALSLLDALLRGGRPEELEAELKRRFEAALTDEARAACLREIAASQARRQAPAAERAPVLSRLVDLAPGDPVSLRQLASARAELGEWGPLAELLARLAAVETDERRRVQIEIERAGLLLDRLGDGPAALEGARRALGSASGRAGALRLLEQLVGDPVASAGALEILEVEYAKSGDWTRVLAILARRAEASADPVERAGRRLEQARVLEERLADPRGAFSLLAAALADAPELVAPELVRVARSIGTLAETIDRLDEVASSSGAAEGLPLARRAVDLAREAGDAERLAAAQGVVLQLAPSDPDALDALATRAREKGEAERAVELLRRQLAAGGSAAEQARRLVLLGRSSLDVLAQPSEAVEAFEQALALGADEGELLEPLAQALANAARPREACDVLARAIARLDRAGDAPRAAELRLRRARALFEGLGDALGAAAELEALLALRPNDPEAIAALEGLLGTEADSKAVATLASVFERIGDAARLAQALGALADRETDPEKRADILRRIARLEAQDLRDPGLAFSTLSRAAHLRPKDAELRSELRALASAARLEAELAALLQDLAEAQPGKAGAALLLELGELLEGIGDLEGARRAYSQANRQHPASPAPPRELLRLARRSGDAGAVSEAARALAELTAGEEKIALLAEAASAAPVPKALELWAELLELSPGNAAAVAALESLLAGPPPVRDSAAALLVPVYRAGGNGERLAAALEPLAPLARSADERAAAWIEIASLRDRLGQARPALAARLRALRERPGDLALCEEIERAGAAVGGLDEIAASYEELIGALGAVAGALPLRERLAALAAGPLAAPERALALELEIAELSPSDVSAVARAAELQRRLGRERDLAGSLVRLAHASPEPARKKDLLREAAEIFGRLDDRDGAMASYREILEIDPSDPSALERLGAILGGAGKWGDLADALDGLAREALAAGATADADRLRLRRGLVLLDRLGDLRGALACFTAVAAGVADDPAIPASLERAFSAATDPSDRAAIASLLEPIYEQGKNLPALVAVLQARAEVAPESEKGVLLQRIAALYATDLRSPELAFVSASRALRENPQDLSSLEIALRSAEAAGAAEELADLLEEIGGKAQASEVIRRCQWALARLCQGPLASPARAIAAWKRVLELAPDDAEAFRALAGLLEQAGEVGALLEALRRQLAVVDDVERRREILRRIGALQEGPLRDDAGAFATYRRLLELAPEDRAALARLDALCQRQERWPELAPLLEQEARLAGQAGDRAAQAAVLARLGQLRETALRDVPGAVEAYGAVLAIEPSQREVQARLEGILQRDPQNLAAADLLERLFQSAKDWPKYASALDARASATPDPQARREILLELARVREEHQGRSDLAFIALCRAFHDEPQSAELRAALLRAAERAEAVEELVGVFEEELERSPLPEIIGPLSLEVAQLYDQKLQEPQKALQHYERAREVDPAGGAPLPALERLYRVAERWPQLAEVLEELVARASEPAEKVSLLYRLGQLAEERLSAPDRAARAYEGILAVEPDHLPALRALERLYEQAGRGPELFAVLERQRAATAEGAGRDRLVSRLAEVAATQLHDDERAVGLWRELLSRNPRTESALSGLEGALERLARWGELAELLRARLASTVDPREITRLNDRLGWLLGVKLGQADEAARSFKAVLERDPKNRKALESLRDILVAKGDLEELAAVLRRLIPLQEDATGVKAVRLQLAETLGKLGRREEAIEAARRALDLDPHRVDELERAEALFRSLSAWSEALRSMEARAELLAPEKASEAEALWMEVARLHEEALHKPEGGAAALEKLLERNPGHPAAAAALERIYSKAGDWRRLSTLLDRLSREAAEPPRRLELLRELASVQEQRLGQKDLAFLSLCRAFELDPGNAELAVAMRRLARETGALEELAAVHESVADQIGRGPGGEAVFLDLARIQDEDLDDAASAEATLRRWLVLEPASLPAVEQLAALFQRRGRARDHALALEQKVNLLSTLEEKKEALAELARSYDAADDVAEAVLTLRRGLELDPADRPLVDQLAALYRREQAWSELVALLQKARDQADDPTERAALQGQIAEITEVGLQDDEAAISSYALALELDPKNQPALAALERLYTKLDRAAELLRVYDRQAELAEPKDRVRIFSKAAQVWEEKLHDSANAIACLEGVLALDPANALALRELERLYRAARDGERLAYTLQRRLQIATEPSEVVALHVALGEVWHQELGRVDHAEELFGRALQLDPNSQPALHGLGVLYEKSGNWPQALEMIRRESRLAKSAEQAVELHFRAGQIHAGMLLDPEEARLEFERCVEIDQGHLPSLAALKKIFEAREEWDRCFEVARQEAEWTKEPAEKTRLWHELGRFQQEKREDAAGAERCYAEALRFTPGHLPSAQPLAELYLGRGEWPKAEEMLDVVVDGAVRSGDPKELCRQCYRLGYVCDKLEKTEKALAAYRRAFDLDPTYLPALEGLGHLLVKAKQPEEALKVFQAILIHHRDDLTDLEVVEIHWQIGELHRSLGQSDRAQKDFEKALELDASHEPSHQALVELYEAAGNWDQALEHRQRLLETLEGDARFPMCVGIARLSREQLGDPYQAIDAWLQALRVRPDSVEALEPLLDLYRETKQGQKAVEVLEALLALPATRSDPKALRQRHYELAQLLRDEIKDEGRAVAELNAALDADPMFVEAFAALEGLLTERRAWPLLEQSYHAMLKRLPKTPETQAARLALWRNLGELYRRALKNPDGASLAYEVIVKAEPHDVQALEILAELYAQRPGHEPKAIAAHRSLLAGTAQPGKSVRALTRLHAARKEYDEAYVSAQVAIQLLGEKGQDEEQIIERLKRFARESASRPMTDRLWSEALYHERLRGPMAEVLSICHEASGGAFAVEIARLNVNPKRDRVDVAQSMLFFVNAYKYVARVLGVEALELYKVPGASGLALGNSWPVCILAGEDMFKDRPKRELWFLIAKALAFSRPELALARLHPPEELEAIFQSALVLAAPSHQPTADPRELERVGRRLEKSLSDTARPALFRAARECLKDPAQRDVRGYLEAVEHTANRAGILLCGDVETAKRSLSRDTGVAARLPERSKVRDLMLFCLSESFFALRQSLGLSVEIAAEGRAAS